MTAPSLLAYALALVVAVATPGPAMVALIARSLARGARPGLRMALGIALADVVLGALALLGLTALLMSYAGLIEVIRYAAAFYLLWLGVRMWRSPPVAPAATAEQRGSGRGDLAAGLAVGLSNPKAMLFHASLMPLIIDLRLLDGPTSAIILAIIFAANFSVMSGYALAAGAGGRRIQANRWLGRVGGAVMIGTGAAIAAR